MAIGLETVAGSEDTAAATARPDTHCLHATTGVETAQFEGFRQLIWPY